MNPDPQKFARQLRRLFKKHKIRAVASAPVSSTPTGGDLWSYLRSFKDRPVEFARDVLGITYTEDQCAIARALPGRVKVNSGHSVGKTSVAASLIHWWFYTRDPSVIISTAPTERDVQDLLWTEVRLQHARAKVELPKMFVGPSAPGMFDHEDHWAKGYTARDGTSFQGRHRPSMFFVFDECEGVQPIFWEATDTMYIPDGSHAWLAIGNPVTTSSQSYLEDMASASDGSPKWKLFTISALNHPNVLAGLRNETPPVPNAVTLSQVQQWLKDWTDPLPTVHDVLDRQASDVEWPPHSNLWYRPGPQFKARVQGIRPSEGVDTVWSAAAWDKAVTPHHTPADCWTLGYGITIGCDVAVYGDDSSVLHVRCGPLSLHHESHNGWMPGRVAGRIKELCCEWAAWYNRNAQNPDRPHLTPSQVKVIVELDGVGVSVFDHNVEGTGVAFGNWVGLKVAEKSDRTDSMGRQMYANKRSQMWLEGADQASKGQMDLSRLPHEVLDRLRIQLLTPAYWLTSTGCRAVEPKDKIKERLKRSPDDADGVLISYFDGPTWTPSIITADSEEVA